MVQGVNISDDNCIININPATGQEISRVPVTTTEELNAVVGNAVQAQVAWSRMPLAQRMDCLRAGLQEIATHKNKLVQTMVQEMGKPVAQAVAEVDGAVDRDEYLQLLQEALEPVKHGASSLVVRQALGVVVVLSPWNFPVDEILLLTLPALASGNAVIVKPSEVTPETGAAVVQALASALPASVLQLVQGDGKQGSQLVSHKNTAMIAMTGSSNTGKHILQAASPQLKRVVLELGGKDPMVVFADAAADDNIESVARDAVTYSVDNAGQVCCSLERIYVAEDIYDEFCDTVARIAKTEFTVGNSLDSNNKATAANVGPLVSAVQRDKVQEQVTDAIEKGATLLYQSSVPEGTGGTFFPVTVLSNVQDGMKLYREETFGPIVALCKFDGSEDEAVRLANDTEYGLAGAVYSSDLEKAARVADAMEAGQIGINCYSLDHMDTACPWVGHKQSGYGYHSGKEGFQQFSVPKTLVYKPPK